MKLVGPSRTICSIFLVFLCTVAVAAQSNQFGFQGSLNTSGAPANGNYDFEFVLFDALNGGNQVGSVLPRNSVAVVNGIFAVKLDFGSSFPGAGRFLEIRVRQTGQPGMTVLAPRQPVDSSPYSIKSLTADTANAVGGQTAVSVANAVVAVNSATQANTPNTLVMRSANGDFSASTIVATQQYNIGPNRVLGINGSNNIFVGVNAGISNTTGNGNAFVGSGAGQANTIGDSNAFFGMSAGSSNTTGRDNSFFGRNAGQSNVGGLSNSFFGNGAGQSNIGGTRNSFFGFEAGFNNTSTFNSFFGSGAGRANTSGSSNSFFGSSSGVANTTGSNNAFFGNSSGGNNTTGEANSFFGGGAGFATTTGNFNSFFGRSAGLDNTTGNSNSFFGEGAGLNNSVGGANSFFGIYAGAGNMTGIGNVFFGYQAGLSNMTGDHNTAIGDGADVDSGDLNYATAIGAGAVVSTDDTVVLGRAADIVRIPGFLRVVQLGSPGATSLCKNVNDTISTCSSSARYKTNITSFSPGLSLIDRLRPVSFNWKDGGMADLGLVAEEVAEVEPLLTTTNAKGEIEGVKYDRVGVVLVNAVKEQQAQIEAQAATIRRQQQQIDALTKIVCATNPTADICKEEK